MNDIIVIFGGAGFLGRFVIAALAAQRRRIRIVCRNPRQADRLKPSAPFGHIVAQYGDLCDPEHDRACLKNAAAVVNLVASFNPRGGRKGFDRLHAEAPARLAAAAKQAGVERFIHISALGVRDDAPSLYGRSKARGEKAIKKAFPEATILRPSLIFGAGDAFFERFASLLRFAPIFPLIGGGKTRFQPVYGGDVAAAVLHGLDASPPLDKPLELGGPTVYSLAELIALILEITDRRRLLLPVPAAAARLPAFFAETLLPDPPLTRDQIAMLGEDSTVSKAAEKEGRTLNGLGIAPTDLKAVLQQTLDRFRRR